MGMIKAILIDADGVVLKERKKQFSQRILDDYNIKVPLSFFKEVYPKIRIGQADLKTELAKEMKKWGWQKSAEEMISYWFDPEKKINYQVLDLIKQLRKKGIRCYLASDTPKCRASDLMENVLGEYFDGGFFSCVLGYPKEEKEFFQIVLEKTGLKPENILFIDDEKENIESANKFGIKTKYYQDIQDLQEIRKLL